MTKIINSWKTGFSIGDYSKNYISFNETKINHYNFKRTNVGINHLAFKVNNSREYIYQELIKQNIRIIYQDKQESNIYIENDWVLKIEIITTI